jgi:hypothetical protein
MVLPSDDTRITEALAATLIGRLPSMMTPTSIEGSLDAITTKSAA